MKKILCFITVMFIILTHNRVFALDLIENASSGILIEAETGKIIFEKDKDKEVSVASMTKMVAQIIILEEIEKKNISWSDKVRVSKNAADMGGSQIYLAENEEMTIEDLMKGISVASANDATVAMAEVISGSEEKFVKRMNKKVKEMGLKHTHFKNCTGLDEEGHYSTAYDMAMISRYLLTKHPEILKFSSIKEDYLREDTENKFWLVNTNKLISFYEGADGLKTGHTDSAKYCLAATAKKNGLRLIAIVLGEDNSKVRNSETMSLLDYGFNTVKVNTLRRRGEVVKKLKVDKSSKEIIEVALKEDLNVLEDKAINTKKYSYKYEVEKLNLPVKKGDNIGKACAYYKNKKIACSNLTVMEDVTQMSYFSLFKKALNDSVIGRY